MDFWILNLAFLYFLGYTWAAIAENCQNNEPQQCAVRADNLLKDPDLVFPDNSGSVDRVCRTWNEFTDCIHDYTKRCLTRQQKAQFDRSFNDPVSSMRTLCEDTAFRREYLQYAPCIKKVSTENKNCGHQYRFLIDHMSGSSTSVKAICCARAKFKNARAKFKKCVLDKTREKCDSKAMGNDNVELNATAFAVKALDKSLAYVSQQCSVSSFKEDECPGIRENGKGPLEPGVQLDAAASNEVAQKNPQQTNTQPNIIVPRPRKPTEKPVQEKLNSKNSSPNEFQFLQASISICLSVLLSCLVSVGIVR
ncbi:unnamed protein product [Allacma fusca]|uniref:Secreted protein n=1 Tax=Allacma fusca TaxID=39272 RepID=A0A8J2LP62_9HEXA|nr:unnamed protein product [Allacma fusca]